MPRQSHPWYWPARDGWYYKHKGQIVQIGKHPDDTKPKKKDGKWAPPKIIMQKFYEMMSQGDKQIVEDREAIAAVLDDFLEWCFQNRADRTAERYRDFIQDFVTIYGRTPVSQLNASLVTDWLNQRPKWNSTTRNNAITALQRGFNWAVKNRGLDRNPIKGMEKPQAKARSETVAPEVFEQLLRLIPDQAFRDLCIVSYDLGGRPQEIKSIEARHLDLERELVLIPTQEAKGKRRPRVLYVPTERSLEIFKRLCEQYPEGPIFRNKLGNKWTGMAVKCRFEDLEVLIGIERMKEKNIELDDSKESIKKYAKTLKQTKIEKGTGKEVPKTQRELMREARQKLVAEQARQYGIRIRQYDFRRTWITDSLVAGVDSHIVAQLSGHSDTTMIDKHYSAIADNHKFMQEMAKKGRANQASNDGDS